MAQYQRVFGSGSTIYTAEPSYRAVTLSSNVTLVWALESAPDANVATAIMDFTATAPSLSVTLPNATFASTGQTLLMSNVGANAFSVLRSDGFLIQELIPGTVWQLYLTDNTTSAGTWRILQYGAQIAAPSALALSSTGLSTFDVNKLIPAIAPTALTAPLTTTGSADWGKFYLWTSTNGSLQVNPTNTLGVGWYIVVRNAGNGAFTILPAAGSMINGASSLVLNVGESCILVSNNSDNLYTVGYGRDINFTFNSISVPIISNDTTAQALSLGQQNKISYDFTGTLSTAIAKPIILPSYPQQYWVRNSTIAPGGTTGSGGMLVFQTAGSGTRTLNVPSNTTAILYVDNTNNVTRGDTSTFPNPLPVTQGGTGVTSYDAFFTVYGAGSTGRAIWATATAQDALNVIGAASLGDSIALSIALGG